MRNAVLHLISNKAGNFGLPNLPVDSSFVPYTTTAIEDSLRAALFINATPYYLINSLISVYTFSDILAEFRETETTFSLCNINYPKLTIVNATYANTPTQNFNIANIPETYPNATYFYWTIKYNNEDTLSITCCNQRFTIPFTLTDLVEDGQAIRVLSADWPAISGIKGGFALNEDIDWSTGANIYLFVPPVVFPYEEAIKVANRIPGTADILNRAGVSKNYYNAQSGIEKYALLMMALANPAERNPAVVTTCT